MSCLIRQANKKDCLEISKIKHDIWNTTYRGIYNDEKIDNYDYESNRNKFINIIDDPNVELYVVEDSGRIVGYMKFGVPHRPYKNYKQEIGLLYILKEYQRKGIGRKLFDLAYSKIEEAGYDEFFICCNKYNYSAQEFYKSLGGILIHEDVDNEDKSISQVYFLYKTNNNYHDKILSNLDKIHTTKLGEIRIKNNLNIDGDVVNYLKNIIKKSITYKHGKNYYCESDNVKVTINSNNYCIITAHIVGGEK